MFTSALREQIAFDKGFWHDVERPCARPWRGEVGTRSHPAVVEPTAKPTAQPTAKPTAKPTAQPSTSTYAQPSVCRNA